MCLHHQWIFLSLQTSRGCVLWCVRTWDFTQMHRGMVVSSGVAADTKGSTQEWKIAVENNYALHPAVCLAGANVCLDECNRIRNSFKIDAKIVFRFEISTVWSWFLSCCYYTSMCVRVCLWATCVLHKEPTEHMDPQRAKIVCSSVFTIDLQAVCVGACMGMGVCDHVDVCGLAGQSTPSQSEAWC